MRRALYVFLVLAGAGIAGATAVAASDSRSLAFTIGVAPTQLAVALEPGQEACQEPIAVPARFDAVEMMIGTYVLPGPKLAVDVRDAATGAILASGLLPAGYLDNSTQSVPVDPVSAGRRIAVCVRNDGGRRAALYGGIAIAARGSEARVDGHPVDADLTLVFRRQRPSSLLALFPDLAGRAALFHPGWVGAWTLWILGGALIFVVPLLLAASLTSAERDRCVHCNGHLGGRARSGD